MSKHQLRRRIFIDRAIQGTLLQRVILYWLCGAIMQVLLLAYFSIIGGAGDDSVHENSGQFWTTLSLAALSSIVVLPLLMLDIVRLSHRWVGPIYRLRTAMKQLANGEKVEEISFRDGDFWHDLAGHFNAIVRRMNWLTAAERQSTDVDETEAAVH